MNYFKSNYSLLVFVLFLAYNMCKAELNTQDYLKKEHSLIKPYQASGMTIPYWDFTGHTIVTANYVRLTPDAQSKSGALWNSVPVKVSSWELQVQFKVHGKGKDLFGDGFAIWYSKDRMESGPAFGSKDYFLGLAVVVDTYSNHNGPHNHQHPYISAMINNGSTHYDHDKDGTHLQVAGCEVKFRNMDHDTHIAIRYEKNTLTVLTDLENKSVWKECLNIQGVSLPTGYYIGASATTGDLSDNHDIIAVRFFQLNLEEDEKTAEERSKILPSAQFFEPPRVRVEDVPEGWSGIKLFFVLMLCSITLIALVVLGIMYYQKRQENTRKRFY